MTENREPLNLNAFLPPGHALTIEPREAPDEARYRRRGEERTWWFVIGVRSLFFTLVATFVVGGMGYLVGNKSKY